MLADRHDINENLLKVALNTITPSLTPFGMLGINVAGSNRLTSFDCK
jgi:hypothetical protein